MQGNRPVNGISKTGSQLVMTEALLEPCRHHTIMPGTGPLFLVTTCPLMAHRREQAVARPFLDVQAHSRHYNRIVGGIRFRQQVAPDGPCRFPGSASQELFNRWYGILGKILAFGFVMSSSFSLPAWRSLTPRKPCVPAYEAPAWILAQFRICCLVFASSLQELAFEPDTSNGENFIRAERQEWILTEDDHAQIVQQLVASRWN